MSLSEPQIAQRLQQLDEYKFERLVAELWERRGWNTEVTTGSNDRGIDVIATRETPYAEKLLIQAKRFRPSNRVGSPAIQQYASLKQQESNVDKVLVVTTSGFTDSALSVANDLNVKCIDGATLAQMIRQQNSSDLVESYTENADEASSGIINRIRTSVQSSKQETQADDHASKTIQTTASDSGADLSVELTGLKRVETSFSGRLLRSDTELDGVIATFKLFGREAEWPPMIEDRSQVKFFDDQGDDYIPARIGRRHLPEGWVSHGGGGVKDDAIEIPIGGRLNYLAGVSMPSHVEVEKISIDRFDIEIRLDHELRQQLNRLPDEIQKVI